jgi:hypothetical protein
MNLTPIPYEPIPLHIGIDYNYAKILTLEIFKKHGNSAKILTLAHTVQCKDYSVGQRKDYSVGNSLNGNLLQRRFDR